LQKVHNIVVNYGQNETKATSFARTKTHQGASAAARVQGGTRFSRGQQRKKTKEKNVLPQNKNAKESAAA